MRIIPIIFLILFVVIEGFSQSKYEFSYLDINKGLSNNHITALYQDKKGFMWIGTMSGLNRYDGYNYRIFKHNYQDSTSISDNYITRIFEDHLSSIWVETRSGYNIYNPAIEGFTSDHQSQLEQLGLPSGSLIKTFHNKNGDVYYLTTASTVFKYKKSEASVHEVEIKCKSALSNGIINDLSVDHQGNLWLIYNNGLLIKLNVDHDVVLENDYLNTIANQERHNYNFYIDTDNDLWIYYTGIPKGVFYFNSSDKTFQHLTKDHHTTPLSSDLVSGVTEDNEKNIWIGTDHGGITILNKNQLTLVVLQNESDNLKSLSQNSITAMYKDKKGIIWIGTYKKGVNYYHENFIKFPWYKHQPGNPNSLSYDDVNCFEEDEKGNIWIGTNGGGLIYFDRKKDQFTQFKHHPDDPNSISNDIIVSLCMDHHQKLWIGTYFGGLNVYDGKKFSHYKNDPTDSLSLPDDRVWEVYEDKDKTLWIGTLGGGLSRYDRVNDNFQTYSDAQPNSLKSNFIFSILEDTQKNLWIGTTYGVSILHKPTGKLTHFSQDSPEGSLSNNYVIDIFQDSNGHIWIGTREGLNKYDPEANSFQIFRSEDGLPDNTILTIQEDHLKQLWMGTPGGLANMINLEDAADNSIPYKFINYDAADGLQGREFNENASFKTSKGELIFGGANGFNLFHPKDIANKKDVPELVFTDFLIFNSSVKVGQKINGRVVLNKSISEIEKIQLKHKENIFAIEFAALSYFHPEKNTFLYRLDGFNEDWLLADEHTRKAIYTNLDPGEYTFRVKLTDSDSISLQIEVLPPFWLSSPAIIIYFLSVVFVLLLARRMIIMKATMKFRLEQERKEAQRQHFMDLMKIKFLTNISHEFRTPLSLIISPIDQMIRKTNDQKENQQLQMIGRNARRLLNLVNQLLDFRKMEMSELKLNLVEKDIVAFIKDVAYSFSDVSENKKIHFVFSSEVQALLMPFDLDKVERMLFNLLSNAFKFTPENGHIFVELKTIEDESYHPHLEIRVRDTGIGIPKVQLDKIFQRFFQAEETGQLVNQGSGIGLSITQEFAKLHGGNISVESEPGKGSCFVILLPLKKRYLDQEAVSEQILPSKSMDTQIHSIKPDGKPMILLIEDNEDFRFYIKDNLQSTYHVVEAGNGKTGLKMAMEMLPELIISDIIMPEMDGIELCKKIKQHNKTNNIPVILLSAKNTEEQKLEGFEAGADDYITKPFSVEILLYKIKNIINLKNAEGQRNYIEIKSSKVEITSLDEKLVQRCTQVVEEHLHDSDFSVEDLSRELGMSRVNLYKKLLSLTGKSPIEFIRVLRLKRAAQLLGKSQLTVAEVAYQVGFNNPKYFTKYFKAEFNILPSQYASQNKVEKEKVKQEDIENRSDHDIH